MGEIEANFSKRKRPSPHPAVDVNARSSGEREAPIVALNFLAPVLSDVVASRPRQLLTQMSAPLYSVRPTFKEKFPPSEVKKIIGSYLHEFLADKTCALPAASSGRVLASAAAAHAYA